MTDQLVRQTVAKAVEQAYEGWAAQHPSLAAVIDRVVIGDRVVESLRDSEEYRQAVAAYHRGTSELDLLNRLTELAGPVLVGLLAG